MPNIKSVKKDVVRSRQRHLRNQSYKSRMKTMVKKARAAIMEHQVDESLIRATESTIDKLAQKGIIHRNAAARRKARLMKLVNKERQAQATQA
ncbi:MAG TPA: 30S ribosomal protein S20 [Armatimonadota bacterium]|jgi:small subunit ribosomal protein S20|nr:30S ribosomal protein S20 [Armatimonadota bacterium]HOJ20650.1 30S ribosomal protein S20 [Armatimonadota bacterium]HOM82235.1 30S ribosomal protein S20 [Armatimonadota bacterium]HOQ28499.1 30S ribosomal protein S20 [Armatimonadota bacterium]HPO74310.1 30S ribosomal protein S20 [Armatimonadota bacterium]